MHEFLSYTWIEKESGFQNCEWVLGFQIGVGNDYRYVFVEDYCYVFGNDYRYVFGMTIVMCSGMTIVMWLEKTGVVCFGMTVLIV